MRDYSILSKHKIAQINKKIVRTRYPRLCGKNARLPEHAYGAQTAICEIVTDQGAKGWGVCPNNFESDPFIGKKISELFNPDAGIIGAEYECLDFALHDLAGIILNMPVYKMVGEKFRDSVKCYDGAIYMNDISPDGYKGSVEDVLRDCRHDYALGYRAFKAKIGRGNKWMSCSDGLKRDIEVTRKIKETFTDCELLVDGNDGFTNETILEYFDGVADCGLYWIEEPFIENREGLLKLKEAIAKKSPDTLIADGESSPNLEFVMAALEEKWMDVALMDIQGFGGFTKWRALNKVLAAKGLRASPHAWGLKLKTHYITHLAAVYDNIPTVEGVLDETEGVDFSAYAMKEGFISIPDKPGFGMELIWGRPV